MNLKSWTLEIWALAGTIALTGVLIGLLIAFDDRVIFEWNNITLNTIISTLSVATKSLLLFAVAECIGQWKWILLHRSRRNLIDFERVDQASRGPLGCFNLSWRSDTPCLLRLGLVTIVLTVAVDPFSQQLLQLKWDIDYVPDVDGARATSPYATGYRLGTILAQDLSKFVPGLGTGLTQFQPTMSIARADVSMETAILSGLTKPKDAIQQQTNVFCPTGNCTWEPFETLGVCHRCQDLTTSLRQMDEFQDFFDYIQDAALFSHEPLGNATAFALPPSGPFLVNLNGCNASGLSCNRTLSFCPMTSYGTGRPSKTISFSDIDTLIWSMRAVYVDGMEYQRRLRDSTAQSEAEEAEEAWRYWPSAPVRATECAVYYCVKSIESNMTGNVLYERASQVHEYERVHIKARRDFERVEEDASLLFNVSEHGYQFDLEMDTGTSEDASQRYMVDMASYLSISDFFNRTLRTEWNNETQALEMVRKHMPTTLDMYNGAVIEGHMFPPVIEHIWNSFQVDLDETFEALAISMTNDIRDKGDILGTNEPDDDPEAVVYGLVGVSRTSYRVAWYWISLHGTILVGSVFFCVGTMSLSKDVPVWKSHSLATMNQGTVFVDFGLKTNSVEELEERAKTIQVSLAGDEGNILLRQRDAVSERG